LQVPSRLNSDWSLLDPIQYFDGAPHQHVDHFPYDDAAMQVMQTLMDEARGVYLVRTSSSEYLFDLDLNRVRRIPFAFTHEVALLRRDLQPIDLIEILDCTVGRTMMLIVDLHLPGVPFTARRSMPVVSIDRISDDNEAADL